MLLTQLSPNKHEGMTLRDYLQKVKKMKKVRSVADLEKGRLPIIQLKPEEQLMTEINDLKSFLIEKVKDQKLKIQIQKKMVQLMNLFRKTLEHWKVPFSSDKYKQWMQKQTSTQQSNPFEPSSREKSNKLLTQPKIPNYQTKTSFQVSNDNFQKIGQSKSARFETKLSINVEDSQQLMPSIMRLPSNQQVIKNKNLQWVRSSNIIEEKEGDGDDSPRRSQKNTKQTLRERIRKEKEEKQRQKLRLKNETRNYKPPKIEKKISAFDYSVRNLKY